MKLWAAITLFVIMCLEALGFAPAFFATPAPITT